MTPMGWIQAIRDSQVLFTVLMVVFVLDTILLVLAVLLQSGRGAGLAGALGGMAGAESALGTRATSTIAKITWALGGVFLFVCLTMAWMKSSTLISEQFPVAEVPAAEVRTPPSAVEHETIPVGGSLPKSEDGK